MTYSPAEVAALRTALGLSGDGLAGALGINLRTVRSWESGRDRVSESAAAALDELAAEHTRLVEAMLDAEVPIQVPRRVEGPRPRGWFLAAAGQAMLADPDLEVDWREPAEEGE